MDKTFGVMFGVAIAGILLIFVLVVASIGLGGMAAASGRNRREATLEAKTWLQEMSYKDAVVSCVNEDSDQDGYVSCTIKPLTGSPFSIECARAYSLNDGCRMTGMANVGVGLSNQ